VAAGAAGEQAVTCMQCYPFIQLSTAALLLSQTSQLVTELLMLAAVCG
jgi:hypothetical protein